MAKKYNPYDDVKTISELKGKYHTAKELGQDPSPYAQEAVHYYNNLRDNAYGDVADELAGVDYTGSLDILKGFNPTQEYGDWYDNMVGQKIDEASKPVRSETVDQILSAYQQNNNVLNGPISTDANGNVVSGLNIDHYNTGKGQLDYINNLDLTQQPWYENLMAQYQLGGQSAAKGALASGAAGNSGNIDSYAAANANRQQLAFTTAGTQAALDVLANQLAAYQNMYNSMGTHLGTMGAQNNDALNIGTQYYQVDSAERQNALNQAAALEAQKYQNQIDELMANISADTAKYQYDKGLEGTKLQAEADRYAALQDYLASVNSDTVKKQIADAELEAAKAETVLSDELDEPMTAEDAALDIMERIQNGTEKEVRSWDDLKKLLKAFGGYQINDINKGIEAVQSLYPEFFDKLPETSQSGIVIVNGTPYYDRFSR